MNMSDDAHFGQDIYPETERTSLAAIFGLILSIGGCLGGITALLGVPLSIFGIIASTRSHGRVGGKGIGVAGLLVGLLMLALWGGCLGALTFGVGAGVQQFSQPVARTLDSLQTDQIDAARANLLSPAADASDAEFIAFREAYRSTLGDFQSVPSGAISYISGFRDIAPVMNAVQGQQNVFPTPATFDAGPALIAVRYDPSGPGVTSITIIDLSGNEYTLPMPSGWDSLGSDADPADTVPADPGSTDPDEGP